jgi:uncharacterized damage-inducible protein DinB
MKLKRFAAACAVIVAAAAPVAAQAPAAAAQEREKAATYLEVTRARFLKSIEGLSEAQWKFKPSPTTWSIAEVAEHIAISEGTILGMIQTKMLTMPAAKPEEKIDDEKVIASLVDRSQKFQAPEMLRPVNKRATKESLVKEFNAARDQTIQFVKTTTEDLRAHAAPHPALKILDTHQWVLLIGGHSARHTLQIEEVKTAAGYPKDQ